MVNRPTTTEDGTEDWDAPLRWRNTIASQVAQSLSVDSTSNTITQHGTYINQKISQPPINVPFCRDPNVPINQLKETTSYYPSPAKRNIYTSSPARTVRNKSPPTHDFEFSSSPSRYIINKPNVNPIKELELIGRKTGSTTNLNEDEPPFNFQGMLRKTNYNRDSMKRSSRQDASEEYLTPTRGRNDNDFRVPINEYRTKSPPRKIYNNNDDDEFIEPDKNLNTVIFESKVKSTSRENLMNGNYATEIVDSVELIPGVFIEGPVIDL